jgi:hypothetical protein
MDNMKNTGTCINCGHDVVSAYCPQCGQPHPPRKINLVNMYYDFQSRIYGFDGMFPRTFRDLTLRPGIVTKEFIKGNRIRYYGPVGYFFLMITFFLLILSMTSVSFYDFMVKTSSFSEVKPHSGQEKFMQIFSGWITENMRIFSFLIIPINALTSKLFFRKSGMNLLEHSILVFYTHGHIYWITILALLTFLIFGINPLSTVQTVLGLVLFSVGCMQLFNYQSKLKAFVKGLLSSILAYLIFILFIIVTLAVYLYLHPEFLEMIRPANNK